MRKGNVEVQIRPSEIGQDTNGRHDGMLFVARTWPGTGALDSPACWTDLGSLEGASWYVGAVGDKSHPVNHVVIKGWLHHPGPPPIW
jgi:hypothetical protein